MLKRVADDALGARERCEVLVFYSIILHEGFSTSK